MKRIEIGELLPNGDTVSLDYIEKALEAPCETNEKFALPDTQHDWRVLGNWTERGPNWETTLSKRTEKATYEFPKYGRSMYCVLTGKRRRQTIDEFYCG